MQAGAGYSGERSAKVAATRATEAALERAGVDRTDLAVVFATPNYQSEYRELLEAVRAVSGAPSLVGCTGMSVLTSDGEFEGHPGVAVLVATSNAIRARPFLVPATSADASSPGRTIRRLIDPLPEGPRLLVLLPDPFSVHVANLITEVEEDPAILPIVGAAASGGPGQPKSFQWCGAEIGVHAVAGLLLTGEFTLRLGVAQGCQPIGQPSRISRAEANQIIELDGRPALECLQETVAMLPKAEIERAAHSLFAGIAHEDAHRPIHQGDLLVRNLVGVDPSSGAVAVAEQVRQGQIVQFVLRDARAARADMRRMLETLYAATQRIRPRFGFYFNCLGRGVGLYGDPNHDINLIREFFGDLPIVGFFGNGELAPVGGKNYVHSYTGVLAIIGEA
jgi:small ligand-binding sensory domain FIST